MTSNMTAFWVDNVYSIFCLMMPSDKLKKQRDTTETQALLQNLHNLHGGHKNRVKMTTEETVCSEQQK